MTASAHVPLTTPRICFDGVSAASPLGLLLSRVIPSFVARETYNDATRAMHRWRRMTARTDLQWWGADQPSSVLSDLEPPADIHVDLFGNDLTAAGAGRLWRIVDATGEPILNPFCLLENCCRAPFIASLFLIEGMPGQPHWSIIGEAHISNRRKYRDLLNRVARAASNLIVSALLENGNQRVGSGSITTIVKHRSMRAIGAALINVRVREAATMVRETVFNEYWAVGTLAAPAQILLRSQTLNPDQWLSPRAKSVYLADPFPLPDWPDRVLCERYSYPDNLGTLCAFTVTREGVADERPIAGDLGGKHLSYPFLFREGNRLFLLPEMEAFGELTLFELGTENKAQAVCTIECGTRIADPTLFRYEDLYWIAYCDQGCGSCDNLCLLYARRLEGPWLAHPKNPVKVDIRSSRPGGTPFSVNGRLFRPAQDCSETYGGAVTINEVLVCTPDDYAERPVAILTPDPSGPFPHGLHTVSMGADRILLDGKKLFFDPTRIWKRIRAYIRRRWLRRTKRATPCAY